MRAALAALGLAMSALTSAVAQGAPPLPPARPPDLTEAAPAPAPSTPADAPTGVPLPPARPPELSVAPAVPPAAAQAETAPPEEAGCRERLTSLGIAFKPLETISAGACGARDPVLVTAVGPVSVATPATLTCPAAEALGRWVKEAVLPEAAKHLEGEPGKILIGTSYECRTQLRRPGAKLSEHAFANAVDVMGFEFAQRRAVPVTFHPADSPEGRFQAAIRAAACTHFTTVLGPGSDAAHADHLHLDLRGRRNAYRLCQ